MNTVASRVRDGKSGVVPVPGSVGRLNGTEGFQEAVQAGTQASRDAQRHLRDVLADLRQCDSAG